MTRHNSLAEAMSALLAYKSRPEGEPIPIQTNWALVAANDNEPEVVAEMGYERIRLTTPSVGEIMRHVTEGDIERNDRGQVVRIGRLRFGDGTQVEAGYKSGPGGEVVATKHRMPTGAMLGCQDRPHTTIGGTDDAVAKTASNNYFADMFGVKRRKRIPAKKQSKRNGSGFTHAQAKAMLANAYANTKNMPPVKICPPGLPAATDRIADSFLGMQKISAKNDGSTAWQDISTALVDREVWAQAIADLSDENRDVLDKAAHGRVRAQYALSPGGTERGARKRGVRLLNEANRNLFENLKKYAG